LRDSAGTIVARHLAVAHDPSQAKYQKLSDSEEKMLCDVL
jgi:hypothetical protein